MTRAFEELGVTPVFIKRLAERGVTSPTAIQALVIPRILEGKNVLFRSATGTGKTFAYLIPLFQRFFENPQDSPPKGDMRFLICAPTYELCAQIKAEVDFLLAALPAPIKTALIIGSANIDRQIQDLKKNRPQLVVGNPGRLLQLERMGKLKTSAVEALVLDEGDRLTSDEMLEETGEFLQALQRKRRSSSPPAAVSCSATLPAKNQERLLAVLGEDAVILESEDAEILREMIQHWALWSEDRRKIGTLRSFLAAVRPAKALIFTGRGGQVGNIVSQLQFRGLGVQGLYGDMDKVQRRKALEDFRRNRVRFLVTSDLAARGLDIPGISHVIALDVPLDSGAYIHRAGRTGRAGKPGVMVTIAGEEGLRRLAALEKKLGIVVYPKALWEGRLQTADNEQDQGFTKRGNSP